jgi:hypothetical protein
MNNMAKRVTIEERPRRMAMLETKMVYAVMLDGKEFSELYWNMRGYVGYIPTVGGGRLNIGERSLSNYRREVAEANREMG